MITRRHHAEAPQRMQQRAKPEAMRPARSTVEQPFGNLKCRASSNIRAFAAWNPVTAITKSAMKSRSRRVDID
jgi:hypothetical protein